MQTALTGLFLPPLALVLLILLAGLLAARGRRGAGLLAALCALLILALATPFVAGTLTVAVERMSPAGAPQASPPPQAIIVLGGEMARGAAGPEIGPLTLERLRAAAALHRRTGLPLLVTGGSLAEGAPPIAEMMAVSLKVDFAIGVRWIEPHARDTRDNAVLSAAMLRAASIGSAYVVSHGWHLPRAEAAFARIGFAVTPAPVRNARQPEGVAADFLPRPDHLAQSWLALREAAGIVVYQLRDGE